MPKLTKPPIADDERMALTIGQMIERTPNGETRLFKAPIQGVTEDCFYGVAFNGFYQKPLEGPEGMPFGKGPTAGMRDRKRRPLSVLPNTAFRFKAKASKLVDFMNWGGGGGGPIFLISDKLFDLIERMDPGSLDHRRATIEAKDATVEYRLVLPGRTLEAVDTMRTDIEIESKKMVGADGEAVYLPHSVGFPETAQFKHDELKGIHQFADTDAFGWIWSRDLLEAAKNEKIRGLYAYRESTSRTIYIEELRL